MRKWQGKMSAVLLSMMVAATSLPMQEVFAGESARQMAMKSVTRANVSTQNEALEENDGLTATDNAAITEEDHFGKMLEISAGWNNQNQGHAEINNAENLFKKSGFTLLADIKVSEFDESLADKMSAFTIGTEEQSLRIFPESGKIGYGKSPGGVSEHSAAWKKHADVGKWCSVAVVYDENESSGEITVYMDGEKVLDTTDIGFKFSEMDGIKGYIARAYNTNYLLNGMYDNIVVEDMALTEEEAVKQTDNRFASKMNQADYEEINIPNRDDIRGNITLKSETSNGTKVSWKSSDESIVSVKEIKNEGYDATPAGVVNRPADADKKVILTATLTREGKSVEKSYELTVKKAAKKLTEADMKGYFFTYFAGEGYSDGEQIYFASSKDGLNWKNLNDNKPILTSDLGDKGVRDPYIIRSHEGDKFYMIATDLKINGKTGDKWGDAQKKGSKSLMVWESEDLVNWSKERMVKVNSDKAGCTWAPEATYDEKTGEYVVYWASKTSDDNYGKQRIYYSKTRDFYTFTEPKVFIEKDQSSIDTTIIYNEADQTYYRYTKNEGGANNELGAKTKTIFIEKSKTLLGGEWTPISSESLNSNQWVEGPAIFKMIGENKWCLLLDNFGGGGYYPVMTDDLASGVFTKPDSSYKMPSRARHGTPIQITGEEYNAIMEKWGDVAKENTEEAKADPIAEYNFEDGTKDVSGNQNDMTLNGNAVIEKDNENGSNVLTLDGSTETFAELPQGLFDGRNKVTISMDVKPEMDSGNYFTFTFGKSDQKYMFLKLTGKNVKSVITQGNYKEEKGVNENLSETTKGKWQNIKLVIDGKKMDVYVDNHLVGSNEDIGMTVSELGKNLSTYIGKSFYQGDAYFKGAFDNIKVYNYALTAEDIQRQVEVLNLKQLADGLSKVDERQYTKESMDALKAAIAKIEGLSENAAKQEYEEASAEFYKALENLTGKEDTKYTDKLNNVIGVVEELSAKDYTEESYAKLQNAIKAAKEAAQNTALSKQEADAQIQKIKEAVEGLQVKTSIITKPENEKLSKVTGLKASSNKTTSLKLTWKKVSNAKGYEVFRYNTKTKKYVKIKTTTATSYTDRKLKAGTGYAYKVKAYTYDGKTKVYGAYSSTLKTATAPSKVTKVNAKKVSKTKVKLTWKKVKGATGYRIYMKTGNGKYKRVKTITKASIAKYTKTKLKKGKKYTFKIRAYKTVKGKKIFGSYSKGKSYRMK